MTIDLLFPRLPPAFDAIGEHTALLASHLARHADVRIVTGRAPVDPVRATEVVACFDTHRRRGIRSVVTVIADRRPDWLLVQYNPFSYGGRGVNPYLPGVLAEIRRKSARTRIALIAHELHIPPGSWRTRVMYAAQTLQAAFLFDRLDLFLSTIEPWVREFRAIAPGVPALSVPIGSNLQRREADRAAARERFGVSPSSLLVGMFGKIRPDRRVDWIVEAVRELVRRGVPAKVFYVGPDAERLHALAEGVPLVTTGVLGAEEVSLGLAAMDLCATPFSNGVSGRRGSFIAALQHGLATVSTRGPDTDGFLANASGTAFELVPHDQPTAFSRRIADLAASRSRRSELGAAAVDFHDGHFAWPTIAARIAGALGDVR